jgi:hypothetical protein
LIQHACQNGRNLPDHGATYAFCNSGPARFARRRRRFTRRALEGAPLGDRAADQAGPGLMN